MFAVIISEKGGGERRELFDKSEIRIGRVQSNELMLPKGNVSKRHATLTLHQGRFVVTDENSTNGTYVNRRRISQATIVRQGDRIYIGDFVLRIESASDDDAYREVPSTPGVRPPLPTGADFADKTTKTSASQIPRAPRLPSGVVGASPITSESPSLTTPPSADDQGPDGRLTQEPTGGDEPGSDELASLSGQLSAREPLLTEDGLHSDNLGLDPFIAQLVQRVVQKLEPKLLDRELTDAVQQRVERLLTEQVAVLQRQNIFPEGPTKDRIVQKAREQLMGLGPLGPYLEDSSVRQIAASGSAHLSVSGDQQTPQLVPRMFCSDDALRWAVLRLCRESGAPLGGDEVLVERRLKNGWQLEASLASDGWASSLVVLRRPRRLATSFEELTAAGVLSEEMAAFLQTCIAARRTVLVVGAPGSDPRHFLAAMAYCCRRESLVIVERRAELLPEVQAIRLPVGLTSVPTTELELACRLDGARLVVDGFDGAIGWQTLISISEGCAGALLATTARSAEAAFELKPAELMAAEAATHRAPVDPEAVRRWMAACIDVVVELAGPSQGGRVNRITQLIPGSPARFHDVFRFVARNNAPDGTSEGDFELVGQDAPLRAELEAEASQRVTTEKNPGRQAP